MSPVILAGLVVPTVVLSIAGLVWIAFGAPCPVTIFTIGLLWLARPPVRWFLIVVPVLWATVGSSAAFSLGIREDLGLLVAGLSGLIMFVPSRERERRGSPQQV